MEYIAIGHLFNLLKKINSIDAQQLSLSEIGWETYHRMKTTYNTMVSDVLGLKQESSVDPEGLIAILMDEYKDAKEAKDYVKVDKIRARLKAGAAAG